MERRDFLKSLGLGLGAAFATSQAVALTRLTPPDVSGDATAEPAFYRGSWRHERRRHRHYGREEYGHGKKKKSTKKNRE